MKIAHVMNCLDYGGMERLVVDLASQQSIAGHEVFVFCMNEGGPLEAELKQNNISVYIYRKPAGEVFGYIKVLYKLFKAHRIELVHTHNPYVNLYAAVAGRLARVKKIINTLHCMSIFLDGDQRKTERNVYRISTYFTDHVVYVCGNAREGYEQKKIVSKRLGKVIYNGVNFAPFENLQKFSAEQKRNELGLQSTDILLGVVARLDPGKNIQSLITALHALLPEFNNLKLMIVGDGPKRNDLEQLAINLDVSKQVLFLGSRNDVPELLMCLDLFVLPSLSEAMSISIIEAMRAQRAIIATVVGGNPELIENGVTGELVPVADDVALAEKIKYLINHPEQAAQEAENALQKANEHFNMSSMIAQYAELYQS